MSLWDMIAMVVLVSVIGGFLMQRTKSREKIEIARLKSSGASDRIAALEERVSVLERLATDKRERLKEEIDAL